MEHLVSLVPVLVTVTAVIIGATWRLLASINAVDKRVFNLEKELLRGKMRERERTEKLIEHRIASHHGACRAAQDYVTGVHHVTGKHKIVEEF